MYKVVISTDSVPIEIREKVYAPEVRNPSIQDVITKAPPEDKIILRIGGVEYEVDQYEFNRAVTPFLYSRDCSGNML